MFDLDIHDVIGFGVMKFARWFVHRFWTLLGFSMAAYALYILYTLTLFVGRGVLTLMDYTQFIQEFLIKTHTGSII